MKRWNTLGAGVPFRLFCLFVLVLAAIFSVVGVTGAATVINIGQTSDILSFDPHGQNDLGSSSVIRHIYDTLIRVGPDNKLTPCLAESWRIVDDLTVEFKLRSGVKFHNGDPFSARDVKFSLDRQKQSARQAHHVASVKSVEVVDELTCRVKLSEPTAGVLLSSMTHYGSSIMSKVATEKIEVAGKTINDKPIGTGPYRFVSFKANDRTIIEKNPDYFGAVPANDQLVFKIIPDGSARTIALETGAIDLLVNVESVDVKRVRGNKKLFLEEYASTWMEFIVLNNAKAPFNKREIREAVAHLVQRESIIRVAESGEASPLYSPIASGSNSYTTDVPRYDYNVDKAKALLTKGGYPNGFECKVYLFGDNRSRSAQVLQALFEEAKIHLSVELMERGAFYDTTGDGVHSMALSGWISSYDPDATFSPLFYSKSTGRMGNRWFYKSSTADTQIDRAKREVDPKQRLQIYANLQRQIIEDVVMIPLYTLNGTLGRRADLKGLILNATGMHMYDQLHFE